MIAGKHVKTQDSRLKTQEQAAERSRVEETAVVGSFMPDGSGGMLAVWHVPTTYITTSRLDMDACFIGEDSFDVTSGSSPCRHAGLSNLTGFAEPALHLGVGPGLQLSDGHPAMQESASIRLQHVQKLGLITRPSRGTNVSE